MRVANTQVLNENLPLQTQVTVLQSQVNKIFQCLQGRISFGTGVDGVSGMNIEGEWQLFTSAGADVEFNVAHTIGSVPLGYLVVYRDKAGALYGTPTLGTAWTASQVSLKSSVASTTYLVFLVKKGSITS